ncbi:hypothetical protein ACA910_020243 [Epithemia clementina (nom. ined.)]
MVSSSHGSSGGSVYLTNEDDYVAPSQVCINPLFSSPSQPNVTSSNTALLHDGSNGVSSRRGARRRRPRATVAVVAADMDQDQDEQTQQQQQEHHHQQQQQQQQVGTNHEGAAAPLTNGNDLKRQAPGTPTPTKNTTASSIVQASLADCLACSGCVTTTETVLMEEQHSLEVLRQKLLPSSPPSKRHTNASDSYQASDSKEVLYVLTLSPAAWADFMRDLDLTTVSAEEENSQRQQQQSPEDQQQPISLRLLQQFTSVAYELLQIHYVLDGNLPLTWSLQEAAEEFCRSYQLQSQSISTNSTAATPAVTATTATAAQCINNETNNNYMEQWQQQLWPSQALSRNQLQFRSPHDGTIHSLSLSTLSPSTSSDGTRQRRKQHLPLLSSSCPAVVCTVEKTAHAAVSHLATTKSPLAMAGAFLRAQQQPQQWQQQQNPELANKEQVLNNQIETPKTINGNNKAFTVYHIAVMPCHDKKLEASRKDFHDDHSGQPDVDIVLTTTECLSLLMEAMRRRQSCITTPTQTDKGTYHVVSDEEEALTMKRLLKQKIQNSSPAPMAQTAMEPLCAFSSKSGMLLVEPQSVTTMKHQDFVATAARPLQPFVYGSGGYADFIFRYACQELFGVTVDDDQVPWEPVPSDYNTTPPTTTTLSKSSNIHNESGSSSNDNDMTSTDAASNATTSRIMATSTANMITVGGSAPKRSARTAAAAQRRKEFYQATLFRCYDSTTGQVLYSLVGPLSSETTAYGTRTMKHEPVLRFGLAYGMQTLQRVLKPFSSLSSNTNTTPPLPRAPEGDGDQVSLSTTSRTSMLFDYVEVMACPSGCVNGGGQLRLSSSSPSAPSNNKKETPTETRTRIAQTQSLFRVPHGIHSQGNTTVGATTTTTSLTTAKRSSTRQFDQLVHPQEARHTTYHVVPPLQLSMGAAAGMAVEDLQW